MTTRLLDDMDECPVESCDADVARALITTDGTKLTTQNMTQDRTCLAPTAWPDGEPATYIVYHDDLGEGHPTPDVPDGDENSNPPAQADTAMGDQGDPDPASSDESTDEPAADPDDLSDESRTIYEYIRSDGPINAGTLKGKCLSDDIPPGDVEGIADALAKGGYVEIVDDNEYRAT